MIQFASDLAQGKPIEVHRGSARSWLHVSAAGPAIEQAGGNSFMSYMLPNAAIRMKQGFGRLIRSREDHGVVMVLDGRIAK